MNVVLGVLGFLLLVLLIMGWAVGGWGGAA
jgi:hypothetical protein